MFVIFIMVIVLYSQLCSSIQFTTTIRPDLNSIFNPKTNWNWLGGDSSASIQLQQYNKGSLWIFGDTLRGQLIHNGTQREIDSMPHSSLALLQRQSTHNKSKTLHSSRQSQPQPQPQPTFIFPSSTRGIFSPPLPAPLTSYYWLIDGVVGHDTGKLFLQAMVINGSVDGFEQLGSDLIIVDNPNSSVEQWIHRSIRLPFTNNSFTSNEGIGQMNGYLYMMGKCNGTSACLSRVIEKDIAAATTNDSIHYTIEYFSGPNNGIWSSNASDSTVLFTNLFTEGTLKYNHYIGWYIILCQAYDSFVRLAYTGSGTNIEGPWNMVNLYEIPIIDRTNGTFSYAAILWLAEVI